MSSFSQSNELSKTYELVKQGKIKEAKGNFKMMIENDSPPFEVDLLKLGLEISTYDLDHKFLYELVIESKKHLDTYTNAEILNLKFIEAVILEQLGQYKKSVLVYLSILSANKLYENKYVSVDLQIDVLANLGLINKSSGNYLESLSNYDQAIEIAQLNRDTLELIRLFGNRGTIFLQIDSIELARKDLKQSLDFSNNVGDSISINRNLFNLSNIEIKLGNYDESIRLLKQLYDEVSQITYARLLVLTNLGVVHKKKGDYASSISYLKQVENDSNFNVDNDIKKVVYKSLYDAYKQTNDSINSFIYLVNYSSLKDSILSSEVSSELLNFQKDFYKKYTDMEMDKLRTTNQNIRLWFALLLVSVVFGYLILLYKRDKNKYDYFLFQKVMGRKNQRTKADERSQEILGALKEFLKTEGYKDSNIDLNKCSRLIGTNKDYLSKAISFSTYKDFHHLINQIRIQKVVEKIVESEEILPIEDIMTECGFTNRTTFYKYFKEETGLTPKRFIALKKSKKQTVLK